MKKLSDILTEQADGLEKLAKSMKECAAMAKSMEEHAAYLEAELHPDPCPHDWATSQGLGKPSICGQCGEEL